jgi:hypothetical protein
MVVVTVTVRDEIMRHSSGAFSQYLRGSSISQKALALLVSRTNVKHSDSFTKELTTFPAQPNSVLDETDEVASSQTSTPLAEDEETDEAASSQTRTLIAEDEDAGGRGCEGNSTSMKRSCDELASDLSTQDGGSDGKFRFPLCAIHTNLVQAPSIMTHTIPRDRSFATLVMLVPLTSNG